MLTLIGLSNICVSILIRSRAIIRMRFLKSSFFFSLQLFVYLFAPLCNHLKDIDFKTNLRLENGLKIWSAMYECRHPDTPCFTTHCRIKPQALWSRSFKTYKQHQMSDDVFVGRSKQHALLSFSIFMRCSFHQFL